MDLFIILQSHFLIYIFQSFFVFLVKISFNNEFEALFIASSFSFSVVWALLKICTAALCFYSNVNEPRIHNHEAGYYFTF